MNVEAQTDGAFVVIAAGALCRHDRSRAALFNIRHEDFSPGFHATRVKPKNDVITAAYYTTFKEDL